MHPYLHEYYSVARFKTAYATPIPALIDQSQWPEMDIEFSMCPPLTKRKAGRPKQSRFKAWFEKGGSSKKGKKDGKPKRAQKVTKTDASCARNLGTEWDLSNAVTLLISQRGSEQVSPLLLNSVGQQKKQESMAVERREVCLSLSRLKKILLQSTFRLKKLLSRLKLNLSVSRFRLKKPMLRYTLKKLKLLSTLRLKTLITRVLARC
nr:uncharacterized protein LOC123495117 [Aegilops tauschii subsp. strangulata]